MQRRKKLKATVQGPAARAFSSKYTTPDRSFAAALRGHAQSQEPQVIQAQHPHPVTVEGREQVQPPRQHQQPTQQTGQSVQATSVKSSSLDDMFRVASAVQQIMTELNDAVSEEEKIVVITKIVLNLMKINGRYSS
jgi:hypothetical protein